MIKVFLTQVLLFFVLCSSLHADDTDMLRNDELTVRFDRPLSGAAQKVIDLYPVVKAELSKTFGWKADYDPVIVLVKDRQRFLKMAGNDITVAFAVPERYVIVIDYSKMGTGPFTLETTLKHELCHLDLHHHIGKGGLPRWLDEGVCQWVSDGLAEIMMNEGRAPVKEAALSGKFLGLAELSDRFPDDKKSILLAYDESRSIVEYIVAEYGVSKLLGTLEHLQKGDGPESAVEKGLSVPLSELERGWQEHLKKRISWFSYVSSYLYEILFLLAALVTFAGFIRMLVRKRAYKDEEDWDPEEKDEEPP